MKLVSEGNPRTQYLINSGIVSINPNGGVDVDWSKAVHEQEFQTEINSLIEIGELIDGRKEHAPRGSR